MTDQDGRRTALPRDDDALVSALDLVNDPAELRFDLGQRKGLQG